MRKIFLGVGGKRGAVIQDPSSRCMNVREGLNQGSICQDQVSPTKISKKNKTWRNLHMFLDILELREEQKKRN